MIEADEFREKFLPLHASMYRAAYALLGNEQDAEDMVQEAYLKLWNKRNELEIRTNVGAYCITLVRNLCFNLMQTRQYQSEEPLPEHFDLSSGDNPEQLAEAHDEQARLKQLIGHLPSLQKNTQEDKRRIQPHNRKKEWKQNALLNYWTSITGERLPWKRKGS